MLYIQVVDGQCVNHPAYEDNLVEVYGMVPANWEPFVRVESPHVSEIYKIVDPDPIYVKTDGVWRDTWNVRDATDEEKLAIQQQYKDQWNLLPWRENYTAWQFNEETCQYEPPIPRPEGSYYWSGSSNSWKLRPPKPDDGYYILNKITGQWVTPDQVPLP